MEEEKESDIRVPLVFSVFCLCVTFGGIVLVIYVYFPGLSQPWYPIAALLLIGSPWIFWLLTYLYGFAKGFCCSEGGGGAAVGHQISRRQTTRTSSSATTQNNAHAQRVGSSKEPEMPLAYSA